MSETLLSPLLLVLGIPLLATAFCLLAWKFPRWQQGLSLLSCSAQLLAALALIAGVQAQGRLVMQMGNWPAPYGISLVADAFSAVMVLITAVMGLLMAVYSLASMPKAHVQWGYYPLMHGLLAGVTGAFITGDLFNLYVWFELLLLASFALLTLGGERAQMEGAIKYVTLNLLSSVLFLCAIALLYGLTGTLNLADLARKVPLIPQTGLVNLLALLFMLAFGIKAAAFPLFFWLPASYHTPQIAISALFAGLLTKVGVYALYRLFSLVFVGDIGFTHQILLVSAVLTMITGVLGAAAQFEFRRILAFHSISQIGYMLLGLALWSPLALLGGMFYILHHTVVKSNLFLISGLSYRLQGTYELRQLGGLYRSHPALALIFGISALSLAGLPPFSGFVAKLLIVRAGFEQGSWWPAAAALAVGLLTLYSMLKIWTEVFWKPRPEALLLSAPAYALPVGPYVTGAYYLPLILLTLAAVLLGLLAQPVYDFLALAAAQLQDIPGYIEAVLGPTKGPERYPGLTTGGNP